MTPIWLLLSILAIFFENVIAKLASLVKLLYSLPVARDVHLQEIINSFISF